MSRLISSAIVFNAVLPDAEDLATHLEVMPHGPMGETQAERLSFVPNAKTGELVTPIAGGYSFSMRQDVKILPASVVRDKAADVIAKREADEGKKFGRKQRREIVEAVKLDMLKVALVKSAITNAFYHVDSGILTIATGSKRAAEQVITSLIKAVGSVKMATIHIDDIKNGLTSRLRSSIEKPSARTFGDFTRGNSCRLVKTGEKITYSMNELEAAADGVIESIRAGFMVDFIDLAIGSSMHFRLTSDFTLRSVWIAPADEEADGNDDQAYQWRLDAAVQMLQVVGAVRSLCELFEYKKTAEVAATA